MIFLKRPTKSIFHNLKIVFWYSNNVKISMDYSIERILWDFLVEDFKTNNLIQRYGISWNSFYFHYMFFLWVSLCHVWFFSLDLFCDSRRFYFLNWRSGCHSWQYYFIFLTWDHVTKCLLFFFCCPVLIFLFYYYQYIVLRNEFWIC